MTECNVFAQSRNWTTFRNGLQQSHYCAADPNRVSDTCEGDSGGPLQIIRPNSDLSTVVGIVSTGLRCGTSFPGIYTRVAYFIDWIESHVWPNGEWSVYVATFSEDTNCLKWNETHTVLLHTNRNFNFSNIFSENEKSTGGYISRTTRQTIWSP